MKNSNQVSLFGEVELETPQVPLLETQPASKRQRLDWEKELLGLYVSDHPSAEFQPYINKVAMPLNALNKELVGRNIQIGGVIQKVQKILTKAGQTMYFVTVEDMTGKIELLVFPKTLDRIATVWVEGKLILASGRLSDKDGQYKLIVDDAKELNQQEVETYMRIEATKRTYQKDDNNNHTGGASVVHDKFTPLSPRGSEVQSNLTGQATNNQQLATGNIQNATENNMRLQKLVVTLPHDATPQMIQKLQAIFNNCKSGQCKVFLHHQSNRLETPFSIEHHPTLLEEIKSIISEGSVELA